MKALITYLFFIIYIMSFVALANPPAGVGGGHGNSGFGSVTGSMPPGLQGKGTPPGLKMLNKTPPGWTKGKKTGWTKTHHMHVHPVGTPTPRTRLSPLHTSD